MGFFSGGSVTSVAATTGSLLMTDVPDDNSASVLMAVLQNKSIVDVYKEQLFGLRFDINNYFNYARDHFTLGLPEGADGSFTDIDDNIVTDIIETLTGESITIRERIVRPLTPTLLMLDYLNDTRGIDLETYAITVLDPSWTLIEGDTGAGTVYVYSITLLPDELTARIVYHYSYVSGNSTLTGTLTEDILISMVTGANEIDFDALYCIVRYSVTGETAYDWWFHNLESGDYPTLSVSYQDTLEDDVYFPIIPMRYYNADVTAGAYQTEDLYITSKKLLKKVKIDIDKLAIALNENPSVGDIDSAYVMNSINILTEHTPSIYYLGLYFHYLYKKQAINLYASWTQINENAQIISFTEAHMAGITNVHNLFPLVFLNLMKDPAATFLEYGLELSLDFVFITSEISTGIIGNIGHAISEIGFYSNFLTNGDLSEVPEVLLTALAASNEYDDYRTITFTLQITKTTLRTVTVVNPVLRNCVYKNYAVTTNLTLAVDSPDDYQFYIPLHYGIWNSAPSRTRELIFQNSLSIVMNAYEKTSLAWYETGAFQFIAVLVMGIITIASGQAWITGLLALGGKAAFAYILISLVISMAIKTIADYVIKTYGEEYGFVAVIATLTAAYFTRGMNFSILGTTMATAQTMIGFTSCILQSITDSITDQLENITDALGELVEDAEEKWEKLEKTIKALFPESRIDDPLQLLERCGMPKLPFENPTNFYDRTIHLGNPGAEVFNFTHNFCNSLLELPRTS